MGLYLDFTLYIQNYNECGIYFLRKVLACLNYGLRLQTILCFHKYIVLAFYHISHCLSLYIYVLVLSLFFCGFVVFFGFFLHVSYYSLCLLTPEEFDFWSPKFGRFLFASMRCWRTTDWLVALIQKRAGRPWWTAESSWLICAPLQNEG